MKKTPHDSHPQFVRERQTYAELSHDSHDYGSIRGSGERIVKHRRKKIRQFTVLLIVLLALLSAGIFYVIQKGLSRPSESLSDSSSQTGSVSLSGDVSSFETSGGVSESDPDASSEASEVRESAFAALQQSIAQYAESVGGRIGVYYLNLKTGETFGLHETDPFVAASSIKMGINTLLYKTVAEGGLKFTDMLTYDSRPYPDGDMEQGTGTVIGQPNGTQYSVRRTSQLSITISDNCATNMVIRALGGIDAIVPYLTEISGEVPYRTSVSYTNYAGTSMSGRHRSCAKDLAMHAKNLYMLWQASPDSYEPLIQDLESTVFTFGIQAKLPSSVKVAHKIGTNSSYHTENDVGIVFAAEPYILCVTTENASQDAGREALAEISLRVYNYILEVAK